MSISGALSNAMSGLRAAGRGAEVISTNISNALTPGYGRRELRLEPSGFGNLGGVRVSGITRVMDASLTSDVRLARAEQANAASGSAFLDRMSQFFGTPDQPSSLSARLAGFENQLITAASRPDAGERLTGVLNGARDLISGLGETSRSIQAARSEADRTIAAQVDQLNVALVQVARLNSQITAAQVQGGDVATLQDQRQVVIDTISEMVPLREAGRDNGQIALYATGGAVLLDGTAATISFQRSNVVTPYMSIDTGTLSGLEINGVAVRSGSEDGALRGGSLGALFAIRDEMGVSAQGQVDALARDLVERFQDPAVDPTLAPGDPGLFTDSGGAFDPLNERGLANRLTLNAAVDPDQGGAAWRLRDGVNAVAQGDAGDARLLQSLTATLSTPRIPGSTGFGGGAFSAIGLVAGVTSDINAQRNVAEQKLTFANVRLSELTERQLADGVDTDAEFQRLLLVEQSYAANAKVIEAVEEMLDTIMRL